MHWIWGFKTFNSHSLFGGAEVFLLADNVGILNIYKKKKFAFECLDFYPKLKKTLIGSHFLSATRKKKKKLLIIGGSIYMLCQLVV